MNYIQSNFKGILKQHQKQKLSHFCKVDIELVIESHRKPLLCSTVFHKLPLLQQFPQTLFYYRKYFFHIIGNSFECDSTSRIVLGPSQNSKHSNEYISQRGIFFPSQFNIAFDSFYNSGSTQLSPVFRLGDLTNIGNIGWFQSGPSICLAQ